MAADAEPHHHGTHGLRENKMRMEVHEGDDVFPKKSHMSVFYSNGDIVRRDFMTRLCEMDMFLQYIYVYKILFNTI